MVKKERFRCRKRIEEILKENPLATLEIIAKGGFYLEVGKTQKVFCSDGLKIQARKMLEEKHL